MRVFLMFPGQDFDLQQKLPWNEPALVQDLELNTLFQAMARDDPFLSAVAKSAILSGFKNDLDTIRYRQKILRDCLKNPSMVREIYDLAVGAIEGEKKSYWGLFSKYPGAILSRSIEVLQMSVGVLKKLRQVAEENIDRVDSEGFRVFFTMLQRELGDEYFREVENHLKELKFREGVLISAELGKGNKGAHYVLRKSEEKKLSWRQRIFSKKPPVYTYHIHPRDESGFRALSELRERGINLVANALGQSTDHILSFFNLLRTEAAFYVGCLNLQEQLTQIGEPICFPQPAEGSERRLSFRELYDVCLALTLKQKIVGNDVQADQKSLMMITGANQGGKSTFLRSIGLAQMMMQCGMFTPAESFRSNVGDGLFTHYKREEDVTMKSGKLDEELSRMSEIVDHLRPNSILLLNESFAATNEREGSEIARQITRALLEKGIKIFFVTHLYEFAHGLASQRMENAIFLRAERQADGVRTFKLVEGDPLQTSYGEDLYREIWTGR